jgi:hypothetical protein
MRRFGIRLGIILALVVMGWAWAEVSDNSETYDGMVASFEVIDGKQWASFKFTNGTATIPPDDLNTLASIAAYTIKDVRGTGGRKDLGVIGETVHIIRVSDLDPGKGLELEHLGVKAFLGETSLYRLLVQMGRPPRD